ncbi:MAG: sulfoxide reductase heme-binding subunit YedZ [Reinekea sp.]
MKKQILWWLVFLIAATPFVMFNLIYVISPRTLGIDPIDILLQESGEWTLRFLLATLACSPLKRLGLKQASRFRRMIGLYTFFYGTWHLLLYVVGWLQLDWVTFAEDLVKRPFIYIGMLTWGLLLVLAVTSPKWMVKRLRKNWVLLHRLIYVSVTGAWVHLWMQSRASSSEALMYLAIGGLLLLERILRKAGSPRFKVKKVAKA